MRSAWVALLAVLIVAWCAFVPSAGASVQPYGTNDFGGFRNILPPGTNGLVNAAQLIQYEANNNVRPPHSNDQLAMYANLATTAPNIHASQISQFYKDATFGVRGGNAASMESPEPGVSIIRDKQFGVPHIYGDTRPALMFGIGYASAEDRLFFIDVLRHAGQGELAQFAGGANVAMDKSVWAAEPYTKQDFVNQVNYGVTHSPYGPQIFQDASNYVAGINAYISQARNPLFTAAKLPAEYAALATSPQPFTVEDIVAIATLVGGIFGKGGGDQLSNAILYQDLKQRFGRERRAVPGSPELVASSRPRAKRKPGGTPPGNRQALPRADHSGFATFLSFVDPKDPEAPTTVRGKSFPYQTLPRPSKRTLRTIALPNVGSVRYANTVTGGSVPRAASTASRPKGAIGVELGALANAGPGLLALPRSQSNALLVSRAHSVSGHPIAVMGPQVAYFAPQILMEQDVHGPGVDATGAAFPGANLYVELGHGRDYAWSATSSGQNIVDTFAVPLCTPGGGSPSINSDYYLLNDQCVQMETLTRQESWQPNLADSTPAGSVTFQTQRTAFGIVVARAKVHHIPVAYTNLRSTYMHELDSAVGFYLYNNPDVMRNPRDFFNASYKISYTFNWFYIDDRHTAYFNSGLNPVRAAGTNPLFPTWSRYAWRGYHGAALTTPSSLTEQQTPQRAHPQTIDQAVITSWNNKQAPGYNDASTGQEFSSIYRSQLLDNNINHYLGRAGALGDSGSAARAGALGDSGSAARAGQRKLTLTDLINAMGNAGTQDLRGVEVLPYALRIIGHPSLPKDNPLARAVGQLRRWVATGAHRINRGHPGASGGYDQSDAVRIIDAWWPLLVRAEFGPVLSSRLLDEVEGHFPINDQPGHGTSGNHLGSAWDVGFYGIVQKDLRAALRDHVAGALNRVFCGNGSLRACRGALRRSLRSAIAESPQQVYPADGVCKAGDQMCSDSIQFRAIGAVKQPLIEWVNRPTFQQAVEIQGHGPR